MLYESHLTVTSELDVLAVVKQWFEITCQKYKKIAKGLAEKQTCELYLLSDYQFDCLSLALTEGFTNAVRHAHKHLPAETPVKLSIKFWTDSLEIRVWDQGGPFDPDQLQEPKPGSLIEGGYGWFLLRRLADRVTYERVQNQGNCLIIYKEIRPDTNLKPA